MSSKQIENSNNADQKVVGKYLTPFQRRSLKTTQKQELTDKQHQRIQIMLLADEGYTQAQICKKLGCCHATARYWSDQAKNNQVHKWNSNPVGRPTSISDEYMERLKFLVTTSPQEINVPNRDYRYPFKRWTAQKLSQHLEAELKIKVTPQHLNRLLKRMGLSTKRQPIPRRQNSFYKNIKITSLESISFSNATPNWSLCSLTK